jgi:hypothetical protein
MERAQGRCLIHKVTHSSGEFFVLGLIENLSHFQNETIKPVTDVSEFERALRILIYSLSKSEAEEAIVLARFLELTGMAVRRIAMRLHCLQEP